MHRESRARSGTAYVFLSFVLAIVLISAIEFFLFYQKFSSIETLEALHNRVNHISAVVSRLGNTLDIVVVGQRFEQTTINILRNDVERIDGDIRHMISTYSKNRFVSGNKILADELKGVPDEWRKVYMDMMKLRANMTPDEVMLIHNDVDVDVLVLDEKLEMVSSGINALLKRVFGEIKMLLLTTLGAFIFLLTIAAVFLYRRFISPMYKLELNALTLGEGGGRQRFDSHLPGIAGLVASEVNEILDRRDEAVVGLEEKTRGLKRRIEDKESAIMALSEFYLEAGSTFETEVLFREALLKVPYLTGATGALVYLRENDALVLKAAAWSEGEAPEFPATLEADALGNGTGGLTDVSPLLFQRHGEDLAEGDIKCMRSFAISPGEEGDYGRLVLLYARDPRGTGGMEGYTRAIASAMGASIAYVERLREEHEKKERYLDLINQLPMGIAVFGKRGECIMANLMLRRMLGAADEFDFIDNYTFIEDDVLKAQGLVTTINKAYDGFITEFIINYDPYLVKRYGFMGQARDLKVRAVPLYEPDGNISKIALIYEEIALARKEAAGAGGKHS